MYENQLLDEKGLDAILVTKKENVRFLTGFIGTFGQVLVTHNKDYLITDPRYALEAERLVYPGTKIVIIDDYYDDLTKLLRKHKVKTLGIEDTDLTYAGFRKLKKKLKGIKLKPLEQSLDNGRLVKTPEEIRLIRKSQIINEKALAEGLKSLRREGIRERDLAWKLIQIGHDLGAEDISFDPIVAFGKNSASPHYTPGTRKYKKEDVVLIDMGMKFKGYCSDMSRTFLPRKASGELMYHYDIVLKAQQNCIDKLRPGRKGSYGDKLSRSVIEKHELGEYFTHANGHGVGLEIHEAPSLSSKTKHKDRSMTMQENMVVTVEPGIYLPGKYGIRIEDMIVIGGDENENLTKFPKTIQDVLI